MVYICDVECRQYSSVTGGTAELNGVLQCSPAGGAAAMQAGGTALPRQAVLQAVLPACSAAGRQHFTQAILQHCRQGSLQAGGKDICDLSLIHI